MDTAAILAALPDDARITVTVSKADWLRACQASQGGPEYLSPAEVAATLGMSARYWGECAKRERIAGAVQIGGRWRLPVEACRAHIRAGRRKPLSAQHGPRLVRSVPRGPQRKAQA